MRGIGRLRRLLGREPGAVDTRIGHNLRRFLRTVDRAQIATVERPTGFEESIEILVPCYNHAPFLEAALESISAQTWREHPVRVTLINDKSTDNSLEVMRTLAGDSRFRRWKLKIIDNKRNLNQAGSLNRAIRNSTSKLFVILNADDILTPDCLEVIVETYRRHREIVLLGGKSLWFQSGEPLPTHRPRPVDELKLTIWEPVRTLTVTHLNDLNMSQSSCSFFRTAWEAVGGYFPREKRVCSFDDRDFQLRVASLFPVGVYGDYPMEYYRTSSSQARATI